jgi:hypothetical protein
LAQTLTLSLSKGEINLRTSRLPVYPAKP